MLLPPFSPPVQLCVGLALGWMLRGRADLHGAFSRQDVKR